MLNYGFCIVYLDKNIFKLICDSLSDDVLWFFLNMKCFIEIY